MATRLEEIIEFGKRRGTIEYDEKEHELTVKNTIYAFPEKNLLVLPVQLEIKDLREIDEETYEQWLKNPKLAVEGVAEEIKDRIEYLTGIPRSLIEIVQPEVTRKDIEEADYLYEGFGVKVPEDLLDEDLVRTLAYLGEDIWEESKGFSRFDFITEAIERGKERLKEVIE